MLPISVTELTSQLEMSALKADAPENMPFMFVTELTSQFGISKFPAGPQSTVAQHVTPVVSTSKQFCTAVINSQSSVKGAASEPTIKTPAVKKSRQVGLSGDGSLKEINLIFLWEIKRNVDRVPDDENLYFVLFRRNRRKKPIKTLVRLPVDKGSECVSVSADCVLFF